MHIYESLGLNELRMRIIFHKIYKKIILDSTRVVQCQKFFLEMIKVDTSFKNWIKWHVYEKKSNTYLIKDRNTDSNSISVVNGIWWHSYQVGLFYDIM